MPKARVFDTGNGLRINYPNYRHKDPNESEQIFLDRVYAKAVEADPSLAGLSTTDIDHKDLPPNRAKRHAWRLNSQGKVIVDPTIPEPPRPNQSIIDDVENATNIGQLKAAMVRWLKGQDGRRN